MSEDNRDVLEVLKSELHFLEHGWYKPSPRTQPRPQFIFEDSPTCQNYGSKQRLLPCSECVLMAFVPQDCRSERIPCRHISLNVEGYTIDTYYRLGTQEELEVGVADWLRKTIQRLEGEGADQTRPKTIMASGLPTTQDLVQRRRHRLLNAFLRQ